MAKMILAVSGGVDSMVMLHMFARDDVIVAHFDHGTRCSSRDDAKFVQRVTTTLGLPITGIRCELGEKVSEEVARARRYDFLRKVSKENGKVEIYTAHHLDDLVESVAINVLRGTGWRGLAVLDAPGIRRPFLEADFNRQGQPWGKRDILRYAGEMEIVFRQDPTNCEDNYLRNRVREKLQNFEHDKKIYELWQRQKKLKREIDQTVAELLPKKGEAWQRSWFESLDKPVALELLRAGTLRAGIAATRPQLEDFRQAILTYAPGKYFNLPNDKLIKLEKSRFYL